MKISPASESEASRRQRRAAPFKSVKALLMERRQHVPDVSVQRRNRRTVSEMLRDTRKTQGESGAPGGQSKTPVGERGRVIDPGSLLTKALLGEGAGSWERRNDLNRGRHDGTRTGPGSNFPEPIVVTPSVNFVDFDKWTLALPQDREEILANHVARMGQRGLAYNQQEFLKLAQQMAEYYGLKRPDGTNLPDSWYDDFLRRWPQATLDTGKSYHMVVFANRPNINWDEIDLAATRDSLEATSPSPTPGEKRKSACDLLTEMVLASLPT